MGAAAAASRRSGRQLNGSAPEWRDAAERALIGLLRDRREKLSGVLEAPSDHWGP
jgi:hypothetical protein